MRYLTDLTDDSQCNFIKNVMQRLKRSLSVKELMYVLKEHYFMATEDTKLQKLVDHLWIQGEVERIVSRGMVCYQLVPA